MEDIYRDRSRIIEFFNSHGLLIASDALDLLLKSNSGDLVNRLITRETLDSGYISVDKIRQTLNIPYDSSDRKFEIYLPDVRVKSSVDDFRGYFVSRYEKLRKIISLSSAMRGSTDIKGIKKIREDVREVKLVAMVSEVSVTRNGHRKLLVEDLDDSIEVMIMKNKKSFNEIILEDEVIGIVGGLSAKGDRKTIFANEIIRPDIPYRVIDDERPFSTRRRSLRTKHSDLTTSARVTG